VRCHLSEARVEGCGSAAKGLIWWLVESLPDGVTDPRLDWRANLAPTLIA
jgi:hypothetical protein